MLVEVVSNSVLFNSAKLIYFDTYRVSHYIILKPGKSFLTTVYRVYSKISLKLIFSNKDWLRE